MNDFAVGSYFPVLWIGYGGGRHALLVADVSVSVVHANGTLLINEALMGLVEVFPSLLCVLLGEADGLINGLGQSADVQGKGGGSVLTSSASAPSRNLWASLATCSR